MELVATTADVDALNTGLLLLRLIVGFVVLAHGWNHWKSVRSGPGMANWFESLGLRPGPLHAWMVTLTELAGGAVLMLGLFSPFAAGGTAALMLVAFMTNHRKNGFFIFRPGEGYEYVLTLGIVAIAMGPLGPGQWSLDDVFGIVVDGWEGLAISAGIGLVGGALFLAMFWRPPKPAAAT
jgi:putative oxidoreductase